MGMTIKRISTQAGWVTLAMAMAPGNAQAMHISDGILPIGWAGLWWLVAIPFVGLGLRRMRAQSARSLYFKPLAGLTGAAVFVISCMPIPIPVAGATAHPCAAGLAAILVGPSITALIASVALALQALFLAHGGLTSLGANTLSMGVIGGFTGYAVFHAGGKLGLGAWGSAFAAGLLADWATYAGTAFFMATALAESGQELSMFLALLAAFAPTQVPLGLLEGFITAGAYGFIVSRRPEILAPRRAAEAV